jgi:deoxyuridine 5'-triphosphate nucleotidohydrolase
MVSTGIAVAIEPNTYLRIAPRSGLAHKHSIDVLAGVVDEDYRGELKVILFNHGSEIFTVNRGDRIAQAINEVIVRPIVTESDDLPTSLRGSDGFGSTGT